MALKSVTLLFALIRRKQAWAFSKAVASASQAAALQMPRDLRKVRKLYGIKRDALAPRSRLTALSNLLYHWS
jgi:hypothetical protein